MKPLSALAFVLLAGCGREQRVADASPALASTQPVAREVDLVPGPRVPLVQRANPYEKNANAISEGQRLYRWYNCSGCHALGGGAIGPPLMDANWIYGKDPENIFNTIMRGRPGGMPSYAGKVPEYQVWQLVAYVKSLGIDDAPGSSPTGR